MSEHNDREVQNDGGARDGAGGPGGGPGGGPAGGPGGGGAQRAGRSRGAGRPGAAGRPGGSGRARSSGRPEPTERRGRRQGGARRGAGRPLAGPLPVEEHEVTVEAPAHGGHCVARLDDRVVFVRHTLPGERVRIRITEKRSRFWRADAVEVLDASADRVPSVWPEAGPGGVGGGELAHVALPAQRQWKAQVLAETLRRIGGEEVAADVDAAAAVDRRHPQGGGAGEHPGVAGEHRGVAGEHRGSAGEHRGVAGEHRGSAGGPTVAVEALPGDDDRGGLGTRTRIDLTVDATGLAGMHRFRSHDVLALREMPLADPALLTLDLLGETAWRRAWHPGARVEAVAPSAGEPMVLVDGEVATLRKRSGPPRRAVRERVESSVGELTYRVSATGFWQVHRLAATTLVEAVLAAAGPLAGRRVLELYSGAGLLTLPLARSTGAGGAVLSLEGAEDAVRDARRNLHEHPDTLLHHGRVDPAAVAELGEQADVVVLDPPRAGAGAGVMHAVADLSPETIVHVACDPAALARDLRAARERGYTVAAVRAFDLFPHTHHFEVVAALRRD
ncbi:class I SAM-dependent RNA methyltransferase [Georgenia yuyongxinii]